MDVTEEGNICLFIKSYLRTIRGNIPRRKQEAIRKNFFTPVAKHLKDNKQKSLCFARKFVCSWKLAVFLKLRFPGICSHLEQIMTADKYPCVFSREKQASLNIVVQGICMKIR